MVRISTSNSERCNITSRRWYNNTSYTNAYTVSVELSSVSDYILTVYGYINILIRVNNFSEPINLIDYFILYRYLTQAYTIEQHIFEIKCTYPTSTNFKIFERIMYLSTLVSYYIINYLQVNYVIRP